MRRWLCLISMRFISSEILAAYHNMTLDSAEKHRLGMSIVEALHTARSAALAVGTGEPVQRFREHALETMYYTLCTDIVPALRKGNMLEFWTEKDWEWLCDVSVLTTKKIMPKYLRS